jgi:transcriptional regulator GlxA family with amidase domain
MQIAIALFDHFTALDAIGPYQVFSSLPGSDVVTVAAQRGPVPDDRRLVIEASTTFDEVDRPDVIVVPGGLITRRMVRDGHPIVDWIRRVHPGTTWTTSVCTGSLLLGAAGVLDGIEATTHWIAYEQLAALGARPTSTRVVIDGKVVTGAGVSAGIDMALTLAACIAGDQVAQSIQLAIEYDPQPPFDAGSPSTAPTELYELMRDRMRAAEQALLA